MKWMRRVRGALGMGLTWAVAWSAFGVLPRWVFGVPGDLPFPILFGGLGFISGVIFSGILVLTEGRRRLDQMSLPRIAAWGAAGGLVIAALFVQGVHYGAAALVAIPTTFALACAASAAGSLALARKAAQRELSASEDELAVEDKTEQNLLGRGE